MVADKEQGFDKRVLEVLGDKDVVWRQTKLFLA